jgi:3-deoxy-7-phosphoheptulonate synthase
VTSWEVERLRGLLAQAQQGKRFLLQGGDCAERFADCTPDRITAKLKILLQMSLVLAHAAGKPVIRVGRFAGQYAKPRTSPTETRVVDGASVTLPSYFGDLINDASFTSEARTPDPARLVRGYEHAAIVLNFVRALVDGGFADIHHPEYWDLSLFRRASLSAARRADYERIARGVAEGLRVVEALSHDAAGELTRQEFFTSHEGLCLEYESAQTRRVPRREGWFDLTAHMHWIGERSRHPDGAHAEFFRGVRNPVGVKLGPGATPEEVLRLVEVLNPRGEEGRLMLVTRPGVREVEQMLPRIVREVARHAAPVLWVCDPMHGNGSSTPQGRKTRRFDEIRRELELTHDILEGLGARLGGVHFELTGEDVAECLGGASGVTEADLSENYESVCDPRLNYEQALELAFVLAERLGPGVSRDRGEVGRGAGR